MRVTQRALSLKHFEYSKIFDQSTNNQPTNIKPFPRQTEAHTDTISSIPMETLKAVIGGAVAGGRSRPPRRRRCNPH
jgi:hypothetical protein